MPRMQKRSIAGAIVLIILVGAGIWYAVRHSAIQTSGMPAAAATLPVQSPYIEKTPSYDILVNYATSTPLAGPANEAALVRMQNSLGDIVAQFKSNVSSQGSEKALKVVYLIASSPHTVSYIFTIYEDTGGAHRNLLFRTFVFDTATGAALSLPDIFLLGYLDTLSTIARAKLPAIIGTGADVSVIAGGTTPEDKNFGNFFFDNSNFVLLFPPYQVGPYALGPQTVRIPRADLANVLKPEYR